MLLFAWTWYNGHLGMISFWGPKAEKSIYSMSDADFKVGGLSVAAGVVGTYAGGIILVRIKGAGC
eukprot:gene7311-2308_t